MSGSCLEENNIRQFRLAFFKYNSHFGYGLYFWRWKDNRHSKAATLHMITIGAILPQFTKIYKNLAIM